MYRREFERRNMAEAFKMLDRLEAEGQTEAYEAAKQRMLKSDEAKHPNSSQAMVGVNPPVGTYNLLELFEFCKENYPYKGYTMCVEQHTEGGIRPHLHLIHPVSSDTRKNHIISRVSKAFSLEPQSIDVNVSKSSIVISRWRKYIRGEKVDSKLDNCKKDIKDREYYNIPSIYNAPP